MSSGVASDVRSYCNTYKLEKQLKEDEGSGSVWN